MSTSMILCICCKNQGIDTEIPEYIVDSIGRIVRKRSCGNHAIRKISKRKDRL